MNTSGQRISQAEFTLLVAALFGLMAFAIDSLLPALPHIGAEMTPQNLNRAQLVVTSFVLGNGFGQVFMGPLSDAFGRRPVIFGGLAVYIVGTALAHEAGSLSLLLACRFLQGIGAAAPRTVGLAVVRDLFKGREMARISSLAFMFFVIIPAVAPFVGQALADAFDWRAILLSYIAMALAVGLWFGLRLTETLPVPARIPFRAGTILAAAREVLTNRICVVYMLALSFGFGSLLSYISSAQQVYQDAFGITDRFPVYFAFIALVSGVSGFVNARLVMRHGMRRLASLGFVSVGLASTAAAAIWLTGILPQSWLFPMFMLWSMVVFFANGLSFGNLNALAMEPVGHIAGTASAVIGAVQTVLSVILAVPVGLAFDGTPLPLLLACAVFSALAYMMIRLDPKGNAT